MSTKKTKLHLNPNDVIKAIIQFAVPIDFDELRRKGILERHGAWFKVMKPDHIPEEAMSKACAIKQGKDGAFLKFRKPNKALSSLADNLKKRR